MEHLPIILILVMYLVLGIFFDLNKAFVKPASWSLYGFVFGILVSYLILDLGW